MPALTYDSYVYFCLDIYSKKDASGCDITFCQRGCPVVHFREDVFGSCRSSLTKCIRVLDHSKNKFTGYAASLKVTPTSSYVRDTQVNEEMIRHIEEFLVCSSREDQDSDWYKKLNQACIDYRNTNCGFLAWGQISSVVTNMRVKGQNPKGPAQTPVAFTVAMLSAPAVSVVIPAAQNYMAPALMAVHPDTYTREDDSEGNITLHVHERFFEYMELPPFDPTAEAAKFSYDRTVTSTTTPLSVLAENVVPTGSLDERFHREVGIPAQQHEKANPNWAFGSPEGKVMWEGFSKTKKKGLSSCLEYGAMDISVETFIGRFCAHFGVSRDPVSENLALSRMMSMASSFKYNPSARTISPR